jgi:hypothetical protein
MQLLISLWHRRPIKIALLGIAVVIALTINLESTPPLWRDEGWTLQVARNWVEGGYYGRLLNGEPHPVGLSAASPLIAPVAVSMKLLGVGVWQGRIVGVWFTVGALIILYLLARRLYNQHVAWGTLFAAILMTPHLATNPIYMGRQVMAELPMMFYLLAGYLSLIFALDRAWWIFPGVVFWGIGIAAKAQPLPFWLVSMLIPLGLSLLFRRWKFASLVSVGLVGGFYFYKGFALFQDYLLRNHTLTRPPLQGLFKAVANTRAHSARQMALYMTLLVGLPTLIGLVYALWQLSKRAIKRKTLHERELVQISVLTLCGSWFVWYSVFSIGWARYFLPIPFVGSVFVAALLSDLTQGFDISFTVSEGASVLKGLNINRKTMGALFAILMVSIFSYFTLTQWYIAYFRQPSTAVFKVADYLNSRTPPNAVIESYEPELLFLLDRPYHYPPDQMDVDLIRIGLDEIQSIDYDPMPFDPDYIVVGSFGEYGHIYDSIIQSSLFHLVFQHDPYRVYARFR